MSTQWALAIGGTGDDSLTDVSSDGAGNVFVVGTIQGPVDIDRDGVIDVSPTGKSALLLASFDPDGEMRWAYTSAGNGATLGRAMAMGPQGEIYVGGFYGNGAPDLDGDGVPDLPPAVDSATEQNTPQTDLNAYYARFDPTGKMLWARAVSGPAVQAVGSLAVVGNGDLIVLGGLTASADLDGDGTPEIEFRTMGDRKYEHHADGSTFLIRVAPDGDRVWARRYAANALHVAADAKRIVLSGSYTGALDLDDDGRPERAADPDRWLEGFSAILDGQGRVMHVFTIVGSNSDVANAAGFSPDGKKLYVTGYTRLGADFDDDDNIESASACHQLGDLFLALYSVDN